MATADAIAESLAPKPPPEAPLLGVAVVFIAGIIAAIYAPLTAAAWLVLAIAGGAAWAIVEFLWQGGGRRILASSFLALAIACTGGAIWNVSQTQVAADDFSRFTKSASPILASCRVRVVTEPVVRESTPQDPIYVRAGHMYFIGEVEEMLTTRGWKRGGGLVMVTVRGEPDIHAGALIEIDGWASRASSPTNPGEFDYARYLAASRVFSNLSVTRLIQGKTLDAGSPSWIENLRTAAGAKLMEHTVPRDEDAGRTLAALLLGQRHPSIESIGRDFTDAGVAHLLAISGAHVVMIAAMVWWVTRVFVRRPRWRMIATLAIVMLYVLATPCGPPILRAAIAAVLITLGRFAKRPDSGLNMLSAAAIIVLIFRPADLLDAGFQLSFLCVAALMIFGDRVYRALFGRFLIRQMVRAHRLGTTRAHAMVWVWQFLCRYAASNLIGAAISLPLVAYHFHQVNPLAFFSGMILLPVVTITMIVGGIQMLASAAWSVMGAAFAPISAAAANVMMWAVHAMAQLPMSTMAIRPPPLWLVGAIFAAVIVWAFRHRLNLSRATAGLAMLAAISICGLWYSLTSPRQSQLTALSVGNGSTLVLETATGKTILIDAGATRAHVVGRVIDPYLRSRGIGKIDAMLLTHVDDAHMSGAFDAIDLYRPAQIFCSASDLKRGPWNFFANGILARFRRREITPSPLAAGTSIRIDEQITCDVLWPPEMALGALPNTQSGAILLLRMDGKSILIVGNKNDAGLQVLAAKPDLKFDAAIITAGEPSAALANRIASSGAKLIVANMTDRPDGVHSPRFDGAISLKNSGGELKAKSALK